MSNTEIATTSSSQITNQTQVIAKYNQCIEAANNKGNAIFTTLKAYASELLPTCGHHPDLLARQHNFETFAYKANELIYNYSSFNTKCVQELLSISKSKLNNIQNEYNLCGTQKIQDTELAFNFIHSKYTELFNEIEVAGNSSALVVIDAN